MKRKTKLQRYLPSAVCILAAVIIAAVCAGVLSAKQRKEEEKSRVSGGKFITDGFENITNIKCVDGLFDVFTDKQNGKQGIMKLDGTITEKALHKKFSVCSDKWRSKKYVVETPLSEYLLLIDTKTLIVTKKQYNGVKNPEKIPCWNEKKKCLVWNTPGDENKKIKSTEIELPSGQYPVQMLEDSSRWGYIDQNLTLDITPAYEKALDFSENLAAVKQNGKWGYINRDGITVIPFKYDENPDYTIPADTVPGFSQGLVPVKENGKCGIIDTEGKTVVSFVFDVILPGENGKFIAEKDGVWGILTVDEELSKAAYDLVSETTQAPKDAVSNGKYQVSTSGSVLNMRASAESGARVTGKLPNGSVVEVIESVPGWAYVLYSNTKGWVSSDYLKPYVEVTTLPQTTTAS